MRVKFRTAAAARSTRPMARRQLRSVDFRPQDTASLRAAVQRKCHGFGARIRYVRRTRKQPGFRALFGARAPGARRHPPKELLMALVDPVIERVLAEFERRADVEQ